MITILKEENSETLKRFFIDNNLDAPKDDAIIFVARENEKILASATLVLKNYKVFLESAVAEESLCDKQNILTGTLKSLLNFADLRGIKIVYGDNGILEKLYKLLGFKQNDDGIYELSLEGYFTCKH